MQSVRVHPWYTSCMSAVDYKEIVLDDETWSFVSFQAAAAAMLGGALIAICTGTSVAFTVHPGLSNTIAYSSALSAAICGIAYINYSSMSETRLRTIKECRGLQKQLDGLASEHACRKAKQVDNFVITTLRYSDWLATFPLLALKLFHLACDGPHLLTNEYLTSPLIHAAIAALALAMVAFGFLSLLAFGDFDNVMLDCHCKGGFKTWATNWQTWVRVVLLLMGCGCLAMIYLILFTASNETQSSHWREVYGFGLFWITYPVAFTLQICSGCFPKLWNSHRKDILFSLLDVISKPLLSVYIAHAALNIAPATE